MKHSPLAAGAGRKTTALAVALLMLLAPPAAALEPAADSGGLDAGRWVAVGDARGTAAAFEDGMAVLWLGQIPAQFSLVVDDAGAVEGVWEHQGAGSQIIEGIVDGQHVLAEGTLTYEGGGTVSGKSTQIVLNGISRTSGAVSMSAAGRVLTLPVDNTSELPTLHMTVRTTVCADAYGDWAYTIAAGFEGEGFTTSIRGYWFGLRETADVTDRLVEVLRSLLGDGLPEDERSPIVAAADSIYQRYLGLYDQVTGSGGASLDEILVLLADAEQLLNNLRNLTDCARHVAVEPFISALTFIVRDLAATAAYLQAAAGTWPRGAPLALRGGSAGELRPRAFDQPEGDDTGEGMTTASWQLLVQMAYRTGAIGEGAYEPEPAALAERALVAYAEAVLEHYQAAAADGRDELVADVQRVLSTGSAAGWTYEVDGQPVSALDLYATFLASGSLGR